LVTGLRPSMEALAANPERHREAARSVGLARWSPGQSCSVPKELADACEVAIWSEPAGEQADENVLVDVVAPMLLLCLHGTDGAWRAYPETDEGEVVQRRVGRSGCFVVPDPEAFGMSAGALGELAQACCHPRSAAGVHVPDLGEPREQLAYRDSCRITRSDVRESTHFLSEP